MGRLQEAVTHARRAYEVDPFAIEISLNLGWACYLLRDFVCAADQFRRALELNPSWWMIYRRHGMTLAHTGRLTAAVDTLRAGLERQPDNVGLQLSLAYVHALADNASAARELLPNAEHPPPFDVALVYVALEEPDSALTLLNRADWRFSWRATLYDPALAPLWQHPQFEQLIARMESEMAVR